MSALFTRGMIDFPPVFRRIALLASAFCLTGVLTGCFDYEERIVFRKDLSGYVDFKYDVPVYDKSDKSILGFLPVEKDKIRARYGGKVRKLSVKITRAKAKKSRFKRRGKVSFRVSFSRPSALKKILLGDLKVNREGERLRLDRSFPAARAADARAGWASRQIRGAVTQSLRKRYLDFYVSFPSEFLLVSDQGLFLRDGLRYYRMGLNETMEREKPVRWSLELIAAPKPVVAP